MFAHASRAPAAFLMATKNSPRINRGELIVFKPLMSLSAYQAAKGIALWHDPQW
jgi:hypothetical protein